MRVFDSGDLKAAVVICVPAMGVTGDYYAKFAQQLRRAGLHAITSDLRGNGMSSVRASKYCDYGYHEIVTFDFPALFAAVRKLYPLNPLFLLGHSLGGQLGALSLSLQENAASGLVLIASCNVYYKGWSLHRRWKVLGMTFLFRALSICLNYVPARRFGFSGNESRGVATDWSNNCWTGKYVISKSGPDYEASLQMMKKPVLSISFEKDVLAPQTAVEYLLHKLVNADIVRHHFSASHPGLENAGHFDWAKRPEVICRLIKEWIEMQIPAAQLSD